MEWTSDVAAGTWLRDRIDDPWRGTMHDVVPRGFEAYARVFHPATRDRPVGRSWPALPYGAHDREWQDFQSARHDIDVERVSWTASAAAFGRLMHPLAQWEKLAGVDRYASREDGPRDAAGWRYYDPDIGQLPPDLVAAVADLLIAHTATPSDAYVGIWEGWGGLVGGMGYGPSRVWMTMTDDGDDPATTARHDDFLAHTARDSFNDVFRRPEWQPGALSDEVSRGARLELPGRGHVVFHGALAGLADAQWPSRVPWTDAEMLERGFPDPAQSPSLLWPADHAWVVTSDVDWDFTVVAGTTELVDALCADGRLEALAIPADANLSSTGDELNT